MTMRNPLLITAIALAIAACTAGRTGPPAVPGIEFATPSDDEFLYPPVGLVILNPAPANPDSVDTPRNRAFCEQYVRTPPTGARLTGDSRLQPIHTAWMVTDADLPADCPQMLAKYDRARALHLIGKAHFLTRNPKQEGPYLAMIAGDEGVLVDGSGVTDFSAMLANWNTNIVTAQHKAAEQTAPSGYTPLCKTDAGKVICTGIGILFLLFMLAGPAGA